jgi:dsRNA-specific ribonuclease
VHFGSDTSEGEGGSKKEAEQQAAYEELLKLRGKTIRERS